MSVFKKNRSGDGTVFTFELPDNLQLPTMGPEE